MRITISFDYDSPAGYRESFGNPENHPSDADFRGTQALLKVLGDHGVKATFAVVGCVALEGAPPEHCPDQVREIHAKGHEVASHSMYHKFIPPMSDQELDEDVGASKKVIEVCIGQPIRGFIPPFNRPSHFPRKGAISFSEILGLHGRGRGRQDVESLLQTLSGRGFGWCRVSFSNSVRSLTARLGLSNGGGFPAQPFLLRNMVVMPLHCTGFGAHSLACVRRYLDSDCVLALYAHPNKAQNALDKHGYNDERAEVLAGFLSELERERADGRVEFCTMAAIEDQVRGRQAVLRPA